MSDMTLSEQKCVKCGKLIFKGLALWLEDDGELRPYCSECCTKEITRRCLTKEDSNGED